MIYLLPICAVQPSMRPVVFDLPMSKAHTVMVPCSKRAVGVRSLGWSPHEAVSVHGVQGTMGVGPRTGRPPRRFVPFRPLGRHYQPLLCPSRPLGPVALGESGAPTQAGGWQPQPGGFDGLLVGYPATPTAQI